MADQKNPRVMRGWTTFLLLAVFGCAGHAPEAPLTLETLGGKPLWLAAVRNGTTADLRLAGANPLRSLGEMAGKVSPDYRPTIMDLLREALRREGQQRKVQVRYPEEHDARLTALPLGPEAASRIARDANLEGALLLSEIRRWDGEAPGLIRLWVELKVVRIADGSVAWERRVQKIVAAGRSGNPAEFHQDAVREIVKQLF
jgi:hypothetical protein